MTIYIIEQRSGREGSEWYEVASDSDPVQLLREFVESQSNDDPSFYWRVREEEEQEA